MHSTYAKSSFDTSFTEGRSASHCLINTVNFRKQVQLSKAEAEKDNVVVPTTMEEYCMKPKPRAGGVAVGGGGGVDNIEMDDDFYDDCYDLDDDDDDDEDDEDDEDEEDGTDGGGGNNAAAESQDDAEDSGNGES